MRRLPDKSVTLFHATAKLAAVTGVVLLSIALAIGANGAALELNRMVPVMYSTSSLSCPNDLIELCPDKDADLAEAEHNLSFDSGASTSSDRQPIEDLVRLLSHRPVIICSPGGPIYGLYRK